MSVSVSTVRESDPDRLVDAADALGRRRSELETILTGERGPTHLQSPTDLPATSIDKGLRRAAPYFNADNALLVVHCQHYGARKLFELRPMTVGRRRELLPFRVSLGRGEALDGFLERLADANGLRSAEIIRRIKTMSGPSAPTTAFMMFKPDPQLIERVQRLSGITGTSLANATLRRFDLGLPLFLEGLDPLARHTFRQVVTQGWFPQFGSQTCVECIAQDGIWRLEWRLPIVATCIRHGIFLTAQCAGCDQRFRTHRYAVLRPIIDASQPCGNSLGLRTQCRHSVSAHARVPADPRVLATARQIDHALRGEPTAMLGELTNPRLYLAELRHLATLLLHLLSRPGGVAYAGWADDIHREAITRTTDLRGPRWGISPPSSAEARGQILAEAQVILEQDGLAAAADHLAPWLSLIDDTPNGPTGWLRNHTKRTPTMGRLIDASLSRRHHVGRRLGNRPAVAALSPDAIPQLVDVEIYRDLFDGMLGSYEWTGRMYVSLCLVRAATNASTWAEAATAIGLDPTLGTSTARAASSRRCVSPEVFTGAVRAAELVLPRNRDFRERESRVRALANPSSTARKNGVRQCRRTGSAPPGHTHSRRCGAKSPKGRSTPARRGQ